MFKLHCKKTIYMYGDDLKKLYMYHKALDYGKRLTMDIENHFLSG